MRIIPHNIIKNTCPVGVINQLPLMYSTLFSQSYLAHLHWSMKYQRYSKQSPTGTIYLKISSISKLKNIQTYIANFFSKLCFNFTRIGNPPLSTIIIPLHPRETPCLKGRLDIYYRVEKTKVLTSTLRGFYRCTNLWSSLVSVKPNPISLLATCSTIFRKGLVWLQW